jgi:hypothetical protein
MCWLLLISSQSNFDFCNWAGGLRNIFELYPPSISLYNNWIFVGKLISGVGCLSVLCSRTFRISSILILFTIFDPLSSNDSFPQWHHFQSYCQLLILITRRNWTFVIDLLPLFCWKMVPEKKRHFSMLIRRTGRSNLLVIQAFSYNDYCPETPKKVLIKGQWASNLGDVEQFVG